MTDVIVIGGGLAGSAAALFAARRGHRVTVLESGEPPPDGSPDDDVLRWRRPEVPHARQGHAFLALATKVLSEEAPDVLTALAGRGAVPVPLQDDRPDATVLSRRLVYEGVLRRAALAEAGVDFVHGTRVTGLRLSGDARGIPRVVGVRAAGREEFRGDLVVDASGRRSRVARWLSDLSLPVPGETAQPCGFFYLTRHYRLRPGRRFPSTTVPQVAELDYATALVFPGDNDTFQLSVTVAVSDPLRHRLRDPDTFTRFLSAVPRTAAWLDCGEPIDDPAPMGNIENRWRRLLDERDRPFVAGLVLLGDAAVQTNPTFGRGTSLAFSHAQELARVADGAAEDPLAALLAFEKWTAAHPGRWFGLQLATDEARFAQLRAGLLGQRAAPAEDLPNRFVRAMAVLREDDEAVRSASLRLYNMLMTPQELMADRVVSRRILAFLRDHPLPEPPLEGPGRAAFESLVTGGSVQELSPAAPHPAPRR
ncbi:NAD(P)/FAD-dependent oxidoreductase [Streptomyces xanthochromogenes]